MRFLGVSLLVVAGLCACGGGGDGDGPQASSITLNAGDDQIGAAGAGLAGARPVIV